MQILHTLFTRYSGGLEQAFINDTEALVSRGHKVTALIRPEAPYKSEVLARATNVVTIGPKGFYDVFSAWKIRRLIQQTRPDVMIGHNGRAIALLAYASWGIDIPLCGVSHSYRTERASHANMLVVLSEHMRKHFTDAGYRRPIKVIPNLMHLPPEPVARTQSNPVVIGALGRFSEEKGFEDLLYALSDLKQMGLRFVAKIAGDGPDAKKLKALEQQLGLASYIQWLGWVQDKEDFYAKIDMLCLPSREDSFPMVVIETLAHGIPIVATDAPGPMCMLTYGVNGLLVPRRDTKAMAKAMFQVATDAKIAKQLSEGAWIKAQDFAFDTVAARWDEVLRDFTAATKPRKAA